ncbi:MAG: lysylphosphatidylglycerol synthase transmembrane domain-containing protein [Anaerolineales bacterium]
MTAESSESTGAASWVRVVGTFVALGLLGYLVWRQGWGEIWESIRAISWGRFLLVAVLASLSRVMVASRWASLLRLSGINLPLRRIFGIAYAGLFSSNFLPTSIGGDIIRLAGALEIEEQRAEYASSIAVDRIIGLVGMAVMLPIGIPIALRRLDLTWEQLRPMLPLAIPLASVQDPPLLGRYWDRFRNGIRRFWQVLLAWRNQPAALGAAFGFTWTHMLIKFSAMWILYSGLGERIGYWQIAGLWAFVYMISLFPVTINSFGLQEVSASIVYSELGGVTVAHALTVALVIRTVEMIASLPGVFTLPSMLELRRRKAAPVPVRDDTA